MIEVLVKFLRFSDEYNHKKFRVSIALGVIMAFFEALKIPAIGVMVMGIVRDTVDEQTILLSVGIMLISVIGDIVIRSKSTMLQTEAGYGTTAKKRIEIAEHLRYVPMGYFNSKSLGSITSVTTNTMEALGDVATRVVMLVTGGLLNMAWIFICIMIFDPRIGLFILIGMLLFFIVNYGMRKMGRSISDEKMENESRLVENVLEQIQGIAEVKQYNLVGEKSKELHRVIGENVRINTAMEYRSIPFMGLQSLVTKLIGVGMTMCSIWFFLQRTMELEITIMMMICSFMIYTNLETAGSFSALLRIVSKSVDYAMDILNIEPMDIEGMDMTPENHSIKVDHVTFCYDQQPILKDISVEIPERTTTAIVGPSGSGKTTFCHLLARFWDVQKGSIQLGGQDIRSYSMDSLMKNFSFVFQNVYLFQDTIANNIRFGKPEASIEEVMEVAKKACCHEFIMELPDGYETVIGEGGASLSGGEKQRISIARAIMKDAPIIILDEATANVDPENERELVQAIEELTRNKTIFMIAHRLKTVRNADRILVLNQGRIVQDGTHQELLQEDGIYARFIGERGQAVSWKVEV